MSRHCGAFWRRAGTIGTSTTPRFRAKPSSGSPRLRRGASVGLSQSWHVTSFVDPDHFSGSVPLPEDARPLAYHCLGHPALELEESLLQTVDWV